MRVALGVEYDGSDFFGYQTQLHGNTVQDVLERALKVIAQEDIKVIAAGRTDTGVHALGQVVHFDTAVHRDMNAWVRGVNAHLPKSVAIKWAQVVPDEFHARFSAFARSYRYVLLSSPVRSCLLHGKVGWTHYPLDLEKMQAAAQLLLGEHDFSSFRASECQAKSPIKTLTHFEIQENKGLFTFDLKANAFLHHMVRNLMGLMVYIGANRMSVEDVLPLLEAKSRKRSPPTFMADGLYLTHVAYPAEFSIPDSIDWTRMSL